MSAFDPKRTSGLITMVSGYRAAVVQIVRYASTRAPTQSDRRAPMRARRRLSGAEHAFIHEPMRSMRRTYMGRL